MVVGQFLQAGLRSAKDCSKAVRAIAQCALLLRVFRASPELFAMGCLLFSSLGQTLPSHYPFHPSDRSLPSIPPSPLLLRINLGALRDVILLLSWLLCLCFWAITLYLLLLPRLGVTRDDSLFTRLDSWPPLLLRTLLLSLKFARPAEASRRYRQPNQA